MSNWHIAYICLFRAVFNDIVFWIPTCVAMWVTLWLMIRIFG